MTYKKDKYSHFKVKLGDIVGRGEIEYIVEDMEEGKVYLSPLTIGRFGIIANINDLDFYEIKKINNNKINRTIYPKYRRFESYLIKNDGNRVRNKKWHSITAPVLKN